VSSPPSTITWKVTARPETWDTNWIDSTNDSRVETFTWLRQCHGSTVVTVTQPGEHAGSVADGLVTAVAGAVLVIRTADCVPVLFAGQTNSGATLLGLAHAGWKGMVDGVLGTTAATLRSLGASSIEAWVGPCIGPECYEFGTSELASLSKKFDDSICARTSWGTPALNLLAATDRSLYAAGVTYQGVLPGWSCTACDGESRFSHRARQDVGRMALIASIR
jgi:polyphenol oxidase